jgi:nucleoid DNA-binding protein
MTLTKEMLIELFTAHLEITAQQAKASLEIILSEMKESLVQGAEVKIMGFGKWRNKDKRERRVKDPNTGEFIEIKARRVVTFSPSAKLISKINPKPKV